MLLSPHRCPSCCLRRDLCFCGELPRYPLRTRVTVVMHYLEARRTTNTARWAGLFLPNSEILPWGAPGLDPWKPLAAGEYAPLLLFPGDEAVALGSEEAKRLAGGKPVRLVVPDGSWRQAYKTARRLHGWESLPRVMLPPGGAPSRYLLRSEPHPHCVSTFEAIARALGTIELPEAGQEMERLFPMMVGRTLCSQGRLSTGDLVSRGWAPAGFDSRSFGRGPHGACPVRADTVTQES